MCGIAGLIAPGRAVADREAAVERMRVALRHRGPDDAGQCSRGPATLGMQRLAIFDPAHGQQPLTSPDGRHTLVFNGALYNFRSLRAELAAAGHAFRTDCDTEVLLAAWNEWQEAALARLRGMYAFAVWDDQDQRLVLARDPFGIKPLYWCFRDGELVFASELRALFAGGTVAPTVDPSALDAYLAQLAVPAPGTLYRGVQSLRPGELLTWRDGQLERRSHWRFPAPAPGAAADVEEFRHDLRRRLEDTVAAHRLADVPVGAFLSGGLDSAVVVGLMAQHGGGPLRTFSVGFAEAEFSEAAEAERTARHFGTQHQTTLFTGADALADLDGFLDALDQPTGDGFNTYIVARAARAGGVTVALSGLGADELFGGYPSFRDVPRLTRAARWWRRGPAPLRRLAERRLRAGSARARKLADTLAQGRTPHEVAVLQRRVLSDDVRRQLLREVAGERPLHPELDRLPTELHGQEPLAIVSAWELRTYMADVLLRDSDVMSMAHSLELRVPFVDGPFISWLWQQPSRFRITPGAPKSALAAAVADLLPPDLPGRRKRGFTFPFARWMRAELRPFLEDTFAPAHVARSGWFHAAAVESVWREFLRGNDDREWSRVWSLAILIAFLNRRSIP